VSDKNEKNADTAEATMLTTEGAANAIAIGLVDRFGNVIVRYAGNVKVSQDSGDASAIMSAIDSVLASESGDSSKTVGKGG